MMQTHMAAEEAPTNAARPLIADIAVTSIASKDSGGTTMSSANARRRKFVPTIAKRIKRGAAVRIIAKCPCSQRSR